MSGQIGGANWRASKAAAWPDRQDGKEFRVRRQEQRREQRASGSGGGGGTYVTHMAIANATRLDWPARLGLRLCCCRVIDGHGASRASLPLGWLAGCR